MAYIATLGENTYTIEVHELEEDHRYRITIDGVDHVLDGRKLSAHMYSLLFGHRSFTVDVTANDTHYTVAWAGQSHALRLMDARRATRAGEAAATDSGDKEVRSFMPGKVVEVLVSVGDSVEQDQGVVIVEAMKMENEVRATAVGTVKAIHVEAGQTVESGALLLELE